MKFIIAIVLVLIFAKSECSASENFFNLLNTNVSKTNGKDIFENEMEDYSKVESTCCKEPTLTKPPIWKCPVPDDQIRCFWCHDECTSEYQCGPRRKCCCQPACGNWCMDAKVDIGSATTTQ